MYSTGRSGEASPTFGHANANFSVFIDCIRALSHGAIFLATCKAILLLVDAKMANTRFHHSLLIYS